MDDGRNEGIKRCRCQRGFQQYDGKSNYTGTATDESFCGRLLIYALIILSAFCACSGYSVQM